MEDIREIKEERGKEIGPRTLSEVNIIQQPVKLLIEGFYYSISYFSSLHWEEKNRYVQTFKGLTLQADKGDDTCI